LTGAIFAVPGDIDTPTGGYAYARRLLAGAGDAGLALTHITLPDGFPHPAPAALANTARLLQASPPGRPILIDGLALGALPATLLQGLPGPVVGLCHHPLAHETGLTPAGVARLLAAERAALAQCAHVITTSATTAAILTAEYGVPPERLTVALPGTDPAPRAAGSGGPGVSILSVGSLTPRKGHDLLVAALAGLGGLDWRLTIAGPADRDAACASDLKRRIAAHGLTARVHLAGPLAPAALAEAYATADLFVLASRYEGFGMAYTEAMAHGLPVVGCDAGAIPEATRGAARLVPPGDAAALRIALAGLIADTEARRRLADACWRAAQGFARWPDTARIVAAVLREAAP
jgi:glycosyltransferase involved in cell wall biosynthesis